MTPIVYRLPDSFVRYDGLAIINALAAAKAAILALTQMPFQRSWADQLQHLQLKREVAGTSRIEGAEFTEKELEQALNQDVASLATRSQRQAAAAVATYEWLAQFPGDRPIDGVLIQDLHRRLVTGCDDDHCPPGVLRGRDQNVTFGLPRHRGVEGGNDCADALAALTQAARTVFRAHDPLIQALGLHYHFAAMHPFLDGNGRTARALEALMLQRVGLRDTLFIAMSNYYYEEKPAYLQALSDARLGDHDLTPFLLFGLKGIERQCRRLLDEIRFHVEKALFRGTVRDLFGRLKSPRKRVMSARHVQILDLLLEQGPLSLDQLVDRAAHLYRLKNPGKALTRDLTYLSNLGALTVQAGALSANLKWPTQITETEFFRLAKTLPKGKVHGFLST